MKNNPIQPSPETSRKTVLILAGLFGLTLTGCSSRLQPKENIILEYGMPAVLNAEAFFSQEDADKISDFKAVLSGLPENEQTYPPFGSYTAEVTYTYHNKTQTHSIPVEVRDTTPPVIQADKAIEIPMDVTSWDYEKEIEVRDNDTTSITIDDSGVHYGSPGTYAIQVEAVDDSQNSASQIITVSISELNSDALAAIKDMQKKPDQKEDQENDGLVNESTPNSSASGEVDTSTVPNTANGIAIVNKKHGLPADYAPGEDPEALAKLNQLITAMQALGYDISNSYSGFRSYEYQSQLYNGYVAANGQAAADTFSARPGFSEHQTGLAFDLKHSDGSLVTHQPEASWINDHAHEYGFIVRYKEGWQPITGYAEEPWHIRYIGDEATDIYESGLSLEEYLGVEGGGYIGEE